MDDQQYLLVIDDEEIVREAIEDILDSVDIKVLSAENGDQGIALYEERQTEIKGVLLDMKMPGKDGVQTLIELRQINPDITVILSSGYSEEELRKELKEHLPIYFLPKPYNFDTLVNKITSIMENDLD